MTTVEGQEGSKRVNHNPSSAPPKTGLLKKCARCQRVLQVSEFDPSPVNPSGYHSRCRRCDLQVKAWQRTPKGREHVRRVNQSGAGKARTARFIAKKAAARAAERAGARAAEVWS